MIIQFNSVKPAKTMMEDIDTDTTYLNEDDAFLVNRHRHDWPVTTSEFAQRSAIMTARKLKPGFKGQLGIQDFVGLIAAATHHDPKSVFEFRVTVDACAEKDLLVTFEVTEVSRTTFVPLTADNSGFFVYAMRWMAANRRTFVLSVSGSEFFWVHMP